MALSSTGETPTMIVTTAPLSLVDFLAYTAETEICYELENGDLCEMPTESELNRRIACWLFAYFLQLGITPQCLTMQTEIAVSGLRATVRRPDLMVLSEETVTALTGATRSMITMEMPPPRLVVEVVSPGKENIDRDYRYKRADRKSVV